MPNFIPYDHNQNAMGVINFEDQIQPGTFEHAVHYLIEHKLDLSIFHPKYKNDITGRRAYDPAVLLKIILFAYSKGITSSREIEWCCQTNIIFKALSCDSVPHYTTIAGFVSGFPAAIESLFEPILLVCDEQGLLGHELFAIDGCKMSSNSAKEWSGTFKELEQKRDKIKRHIRHDMAEHKKADESESLSEARKQRSQQAIKTLTRSYDKIEHFLATNYPRQGHSKTKKEVKSNITDNESAKMTTSKGTKQGYNGIASVDKKHQVIIDAEAFGSGQEQHTLQPILTTIQERYRRLGLSDDIYKDKIIVTADTGFANEANMQYLNQQNINAYIPDNQFRSRDPKFTNQKEKYGKRHANEKKAAVMVPATELDFDPVNLQCRCPAGELIGFRNQRKDTHGHLKVYFEGKLSQCRHCKVKQQCMKNPAAADHRKGNGRQVSFIIEKNTRAANYTDWMKQRIDSEKGKLIYSHRVSVVEPVFGNIGINKRLNRFSLHGKDKVQGQWKLYCMIHNIEKLANYGKMAA